MKNILKRVIILSIVYLLSAQAEDVRCVPITEDNEYICTNSWKNAMMSWFDYEHGYFGVEQQVKGSDEEKARTNEVIRLMKTYLIEEVTLYNEETRERCNNYNELCAFWASERECDNNRVYMLKTCPLACRFCLASYIMYKDRSAHAMS